jgi:hypothetical protein
MFLSKQVNSRSAKEALGCSDGTHSAEHRAARRCFATARELGLEQGEQVRLLKLAAEHAAETERAARRQATASAADLAALSRPRTAGQRSAPRHQARDSNAAAASAPGTVDQAVAAAAEAQGQDPQQGPQRDLALRDDTRDGPMPAAEGSDPQLPNDDRGLHAADDASEQELASAAPAAVAPAVGRPQDGTVDGTEEEPRSSSRGSNGAEGSPAGKADWLRGLYWRLQAEVQVSGLGSRSFCRSQISQVCARTCRTQANNDVVNMR